MIRASLPPMSNRESWVDEIQVYDADDGTLFDLTGCTVQIMIQRTRSWAQWPSGYVPFFDYGNVSTPSLLGTTENGKVSIIDLGTIHFAFTEADMTALWPGQYKVAATMTRDGETIQLIILDMPILSGVVPQ